MQLGMIWAEARGRVIGTGDGMPWHVPEDLAHFKS
ncbi:dihydrofolate reductase, partial [Agrococcus casei]